MADPFVVLAFVVCCPLCGHVVPPGTGTVVTEHHKGFPGARRYHVQMLTTWCDDCATILPPLPWTPDADDEA